MKISNVEVCIQCTSVSFSDQADYVHVNCGYLVKMYTHVYYPLGPNVVYN